MGVRGKSARISSSRYCQISIVVLPEFFPASRRSLPEQAALAEAIVRTELTLLPAVLMKRTCDTAPVLPAVSRSEPEATCFWIQPPRRGSLDGDCKGNATINSIRRHETSRYVSESSPSALCRGHSPKDQSTGGVRHRNRKSIFEQLIKLV